MRWTIATDTPVGRVRMSLPVRQTSANLNVIEWSPALHESQNLMRYSLKFEELHPGVGLMGEARLSSALERRINEAIEGFLARVKEKLEGSQVKS